MHVSQTNSLWQGVGEVSNACEVGYWRRVQGPTKAVFTRRKTILWFVKCEGCGSNSEVLIRPSNSDVSAQLWERIGRRRVVWEKHIIEGPKSLIRVLRRICTYARTHWCPNVQKLTLTHTHARRHTQNENKKKIPKPIKMGISQNQKNLRIRHLSTAWSSVRSWVKGGRLWLWGSRVWLGGRCAVVCGGTQEEEELVGGFSSVGVLVGWLVSRVVITHFVFKAPDLIQKFMVWRLFCFRSFENNDRVRESLIFEFASWFFFVDAPYYW